MAYTTVGQAIERNRIASEDAYVILLEVDVRDGSGNHVDFIRIARNTENVEYPTGSGKLFEAGNFDIDVTEEANKLPRVSVTARDMSGIIRERMEAYRGGVGFKVKIIIVNGGALDGPPEMEEEFEVIAASAPPGYVVSFELGAPNPLTIRFPKYLQFRNRCLWRYKGPRCKYAGALGSCDFTLDGANGCRAHNNVANFGGFPGLRPLSV